LLEAREILVREAPGPRIGEVRGEEGGAGLKRVVGNEEDEETVSRHQALGPALKESVLEPAMDPVEVIGRIEEEHGGPVVRLDRDVEGVSLENDVPRATLRRVVARRGPLRRLYQEGGFAGVIRASRAIRFARASDGDRSVRSDRPCLLHPNVELARHALLGRLWCLLRLPLSLEKKRS
jgi:hypothetical protein